MLRVRFIQKEGKKLFDPVYLFDEGSTISWIPCGRKLTCSFPGIKFYYGPDTYYGEEVRLELYETPRIAIMANLARLPRLVRCCPQSLCRLFVSHDSLFREPASMRLVFASLLLSMDR